MKPDEFAALQPGEFCTWMKACRARRKEDDYRTAYFVMWLLAPYGKTDCRDIAGALWGEQRTVQQDMEEKAKERDTLCKEFGIKR